MRNVIMKLPRNRKAIFSIIMILLMFLIFTWLGALTSIVVKPEIESIQLFKQHIWHNGTTFSEATFLLINTGSGDIVIDKINVRGQECVWNTVYYNKNTDTISHDLNYVTPNADGTLTGKNASIGGKEYTLTPASDDLILQSGWSMIIYITNPDSISINDIGLAIGITVFTANAQYYKECNVQASI